MSPEKRLRLAHSLIAHMESPLVIVTYVEPSTMQARTEIGGELSTTEDQEATIELATNLLRNALQTVETKAPDEIRDYKRLNPNDPGG